MNISRILQGVLLIVLPTVALAQAPSIFGQAPANQEGDFQCAVASAAEAGLSPKGSAAHNDAMGVYIFYMGRLTIRDEKVRWQDRVAERVIDLRPNARSPETYKSCSAYYVNSIL